MGEVEEVRKSQGNENRFGRWYGFEIKLRCVKLHLEKGLPFSEDGFVSHDLRHCFNTHMRKAGVSDRDVEKPTLNIPFDMIHLECVLCKRLFETQNLAESHGRAHPYYCRFLSKK